MNRPSSQQQYMDRYTNIILPATVDLVQAAIAGSVVNAENAPDVIASIGRVVADLLEQPGVFDKQKYETIFVGSTSFDLGEAASIVEKYASSAASSASAPLPRPHTVHPVAETMAKPEGQVSADADPAQVATARVIPFAKPRQEALSSDHQLSISPNAIRYGRRKSDHQPPFVQRPPQFHKAPAETSRKLPKGVSSVNETVLNDAIICLEDGRKVKDLAKHLEAKGVSQKDYLEKWDLPASYPMRAPRLIQSRGTVREFNPAIGSFQVVNRP